MKRFKINGYYGYFIPNHHLANKSGIVYEHILVAEESILGRKIKPEEVVHHKDKNRGNNNPDNLMVFRSKADHVAFHHGLNAIEINNVYYCPDLHKSITCPLCGNTKSVGAKLCCDCRKKLVYPVKPSKEKLVNDLTNFKFKSDIARKYNVTSTTINRWLKYYNIQ